MLESSQRFARLSSYHEGVIMDPNETLRLARKALAEGRYRDAATHYADLINWQLRGGFPPDDWR